MAARSPSRASDPLTAAEIERAVACVRAARFVTQSSILFFRVQVVEREELQQQQRNAARPDDDRRAFVSLLVTRNKRSDVYEGIVSLAAAAAATSSSAAPAPSVQVELATGQGGSDGNGGGGGSGKGGDRLVEWRRVPGVQPSLTADEYSVAEHAVKASPAVAAALSLRGFTPEQLMVDVWCTGEWLSSGDGPERRLARPLLFVHHRGGDDNGYASPLEGTDVLVDLTLGAVVDVVDKAVVPVPPYDPYSEYIPRRMAAAAAEAAATAAANGPPPPPPLSRLEITQPDGPGFTVDGWNVRWANWDLRVGFNPREGLTLHDLAFTDFDRSSGGSPGGVGVGVGARRPVVHRASVSEMIVPYGSPFDPSWRKCAFDAGEDGLGVNANSLTRGGGGGGGGGEGGAASSTAATTIAGCDCLGHIYYWDAHMVGSGGGVETVPNAICMHEEDDGLLWKHTDWRSGEAVSRRSRRLVLSFITTVANYEYAFYWHLYLSGTIELEVKLTGIISCDVSPTLPPLSPPLPAPAGGGSASGSSGSNGGGGGPATVAAAAAAGKPEAAALFGVPVAPGLSGVVHQHFFNVRLDMAVDGGAPEGSALYEMNVGRPAPSDDGDDDYDPHGNAFRHTETLLETEGDARRQCSSLSSRAWKVASLAHRNRMGTPCAYRLVPGGNTRPHAAPDSFLMRRAGFLRHQLWATEHRPGELHSSGPYPNQRSGDDGLSIFSRPENRLTGKRIVLWYTLGVTHVPRAEDWPVMPVQKCGFHLEPDNFFDRNPTIRLPAEAVEAEVPESKP